MWLGESAVLRQEQEWIAGGAPPRDTSVATAWREDAEPENLELIGIYGSLLRGQHAGMTDALNLPAVVAAMDLLDVETSERGYLARRLIYLHGLVREIERAKEKESRG